MYKYGFLISICPNQHITPESTKIEKSHLSTSTARSHHWNLSSQSPHLLKIWNTNWRCYNNTQTIEKLWSSSTVLPRLTKKGRFKDCVKYIQPLQNIRSDRAQCEDCKINQRYSKEVETSYLIMKSIIRFMLTSICVTFRFLCMS